MIGEAVADECLGCGCEKKPRSSAAAAAIHPEVSLLFMVASPEQTNGTGRQPGFSASVCAEAGSGGSMIVRSG